MRRALRFWLLALGVMALLIPFPTTTVPDWHLEVVDEKGLPLPRAEVVERWSHGLVWGENSESKLSDESGVVEFPRRSFWCPFVIRIAASVIDYVNRLAMLHGSRVGPWATVWIRGGRDFVYYAPGGELRSRIVYRP